MKTPETAETTGAGWTVVVPVKGTVAAKSRLTGGTELALAIALDTVAAAIGAAVVERVIVVTTATAAASFEHLGAQVVVVDRPGLSTAITAGIAAAGERHVAVMLGDLPALQPRELTAALTVAREHPLAFVADADDSGTVLITALWASDHRPAFGAGSRAAHLDAGYIEVGQPRDSGLRRDVDTRAHLEALAAEARLGERTRSLVVSESR